MASTSAMAKGSSNDSDALSAPILPNDEIFTPACVVNSSPRLQLFQCIGVV